MRTHLLCLAAAATALAVPATFGGAKAAFTPARAAAPTDAVRVHRGDRDRHWRGGDRRHHRDRDRRRGGVYVDYYDNSGWALYNNRSWESDSYNDWWHDRPDRAVPRWIQGRQRGAACETPYWSGNGWTC